MVQKLLENWIHRRKCIWADNIKLDLKVIDSENMKGIELTQNHAR
jgi:hypothetical protein